MQQPHTFPNFLIIGAAKTGTTSLYHYLHQHPAIFMSEKKEPHFFCFDEHLPVFPNELDNRMWQRLAVLDKAAYQALFENASEPLRGEASTNYLYYHDVAASRIRQYNPDMKLIAILRNPVDRAFSAYAQRRRDYRETLPTFMDAVQVELERIKNGAEPGAYYIRGSLYYEPLQTYFELFPPEQIKILIYETDIQTNIEKTMREIFSFLGVDDTVTIDFTKQYNTHGELQNPFLRWSYRTLLYRNYIQAVTKQLPAWIVDPLRKAMYAMRERDGIKPVLSDDVRRELQGQFQDDILKTQTLIARDLSMWLLNTYEYANAT